MNNTNTIVRTRNNTANPTGYLVVLGRNWQNRPIYLTRGGDSSQTIGDAKVYATAQGARRSYPELEILPVWGDPQRLGADALIAREGDWGRRE